MTSLSSRLEQERERASEALGFSRHYSIGVDEVGRGCLAGPVVACALLFHKPELFPAKDVRFLRDSKTLSAKQRQRLYRLLQPCVIFAAASCSVEEIDQHNILQATMIAMQRAVEALCIKISPSYDTIAIVDGNRAPNLEIPHFCAVQGDQHCVSIAAASIMAKTLRDRLMAQYDVRYPFYGWKTNAGYGTKTHMEGLKKHGVTPLHRQSFRPVRKVNTAYSCSSP